MSALFQNVLEASAQGGILILAVLLLRLALKKAPKRYLCLLWLLVGLRLLVPLHIESEFSLQPDMPQLAETWTEIAEAQLPATPAVMALPDNVEIPEGDDVQVTVNHNAVTEEHHAVIDWGEVAAYVWIAVAAGLGIYSLISYLNLKCRVREAVKLADGIWECGRIETAFILGYLRPQIYLPMGLTREDRLLILEHEWMHLRRGDHWVRLAGFVGLTVHWFNPLAWLAYALLCRDMEMACDEQVVRDMGLEERKRYSAALLRCSTGRRHFAACPVAFGEVSVKQRILAVLSYRKPRHWLTVSAVLAVIVTAVCFLTDPALTTGEKSLRKIKSELKRIQSMGYYSVLEEHTYDNAETETEYWKLGDDWLRIHRAPGTDGRGYMGVDGVYFDSRDLETWEQIDLTSDGIYDPWLYELDLEAEGAKFNSAQGTEDEYSIRVMFSALYDRHQTEIGVYHVADFFFIDGILEHVEQNIQFDHGGWMKQTTYVLGNPAERVSVEIVDQYRKTEAGQNANPDWDVTMTVTEASSTGLVVEIDAPVTIVMDQWDVQVLSEGVWTDVPMLPQESEWPWQEHAWIKLTDDGFRRIELEWETVYGELPPGQYRLCKSLMLIKDGCGYSGLFRAPFEIPDGNKPVTQERAQPEDWEAECRAVLDEIQSRDSYHIRIERQFDSEMILDEWNESEYWSYGGDWLHILRNQDSGTLDGVMFDGIYGDLYMDGNYYSGYSSNQERVWGQERLVETHIPAPWLYTFDMDAQAVEAISRKDTEEGYEIRLMVYAPYDPDSFDSEEYCVDFAFDREGNFRYATQYVSGTGELMGEIVPVSIVSVMHAYECTEEDFMNAVHSYAGDLEIT